MVYYHQNPIMRTLGLTVSIDGGDEATSGTIGGVDDTSIGIIGVSSTSSKLMLVDGAYLRTDVCLVPLI